MKPLKEHYIASYDTLLDLRYVCFKEDKNAYELINDVIKMLEGGDYPKTTKHLEKAMKKHKQAIEDINYLLIHDVEEIIHIQLYDIDNEENKWIITIEKLEEMKKDIRDKNFKKVMDFLNALFYKDYIGMTKYTLSLDKKMLENMKDEHGTYLKHLEKCLKNRRLRILTNYE